MSHFVSIPKGFKLFLSDQWFSSANAEYFSDPIKDVDAANKVGLHTIWMRSKGKSTEGETNPDVTIEDIRALPEAIRKFVDR